MQETINSNIINSNIINSNSNQKETTTMQNQINTVITAVNRINEPEFRCKLTQAYAFALQQIGARVPSSGSTYRYGVIINHYNKAYMNVKDICDDVEAEGEVSIDVHSLDIKPGRMTCFDDYSTVMAALAKALHEKVYSIMQTIANN